MGVIKRKLLINRLLLKSGHKHEFIGSDGTKAEVEMSGEKFVVHVNGIYLKSKLSKSSIEKTIDDLDSKHDLNQLK